MENEEFGLECENCECLTCIKNDDSICQNCSKCNGNKGYSKWKMNCRKCEECNNPEETINVVLGGIVT